MRQTRTREINWFTVEDPHRCLALHFTTDAPVRVKEDRARDMITVETNDERSIDWTPVAIVHTVPDGMVAAATMIALGAFGL